MLDFDYWAKQSRWENSEASALLAGIEPDVFEKCIYSSSRDWFLRLPNAQKCVEIYETLKRDQEHSHQTKIYTKNSPLVYMKWARDREFQIPDELHKAISKYLHIHEEISKPKTIRTPLAEAPDDSVTLTSEAANELIMEPLWFLYTGILYLHGLKATICPADDETTVKRDPLLEKHYGYAIDSFKAKKLKLIEIEEPLKLDFYKTYKVVPSDLLAWSKTIPHSFPIHNLIAPKTGMGDSQSSRSYCTQEMQLLFDAAIKFWSHYDLAKPDPNKAPLKKEVMDWLTKEAKARGFEVSRNVAGVMDTIMRCPQARKGGNSL